MDRQRAILFGLFIRVFDEQSPDQAGANGFVDSRGPRCVCRSPTAFVADIAGRPAGFPAGSYVGAQIAEAFRQRAFAAGSPVFADLAGGGRDDRDRGRCLGVFQERLGPYRAAFRQDGADS